MNTRKIDKIVLSTLNEYCQINDINIDLDMNTPLIGENRIFDSLGLVSFIVDVEMNLLDEGFRVSLTSEIAMSARISPFRTVGSFCNFIENQIEQPNE